MNEKFIEIINDMADVLNAAQLKRLQEVLLKRLVKDEPEKKKISNQEYLNKFLEAKKIEGCSERTIKYYKVTVEQLLKKVLHPIRKVTTEQMREYLVDYQKINNCGKTTIDNVRRNISSFFSWLEEEDYILKSPMRRIHKIRAEKLVKNVITDEDIERLRDGCDCLRDVAMIDLLYSTGIRVGELVRLNRADINFSERECVVFGKGDKERIVYFDARTKIHLQNYLSNRKDENKALFVSIKSPNNRLTIGAIETIIRNLGKRLDIPKAHPHKFRRTLATKAIDKGMPIEQLQKL